MRQLKLLFLMVVCCNAFGADISGSPSQWELFTQASIVTPTHVELVETDYNIPYREILSGFPAIHLGIATTLKELDNFQVFGLARAGFSYKRGFYRLPSAIRSSADSELSLLWVPLSIGTRVQFTPPRFPFMRPSLGFNIGIEFLRQNSSIQELMTRAWLPYYSITPALGFFEQQGETFNGFIFGISHIDSFGVSQKVRSLSFDLTFSFLL